VSSAYLRIDGVTKSYDGVTDAVRDVSIDINKGEFVTFLGPSGSGKTTTLMMIAGFEEPTQGKILLAGKDLSHLKPWSRNIGMVFQNYALFPHMTVARNVEFPLRMRGASKIDIRRRVGDVLNLVGLTAFSERYPREISGGQQQRVALARGLVFNPDVLLLDEPLGALDKHLREQMQAEIKRIHREVGITMIYVTHDQTEAMTMSDRVAVFGRGKLEQIAGPLEVYHNPQTRFVGEFVGDSNFFTGVVESGLPGALSVEGLGTIRVTPEKIVGCNPGRAYDVMIRPERVRLATCAVDSGMNTFDMLIDTIVNYGDSLMIVGSISGKPLRMRVTDEAFAGLAEGAVVRVGWIAGEVHLIPRP
jgi:putative spermidine/putrescine transport system ATP-binding protein